LEGALQARMSETTMPERRTDRAPRKQRNAVFRAIADPTRREIPSVLRTGRRTVGEIAGEVRMSRPAVSEHLGLLRSAGLVTTRQEGASHFCGLNANSLRAINDWLRHYGVMQSLKRHTEEKP
jgi:DNA-binding transcriptional ArsR family regulator